MGKIHKLDDNIINLIAAGEVVERPASVVKELVENSIDAGSTKVIIEIKQGGLEEIKITDNGHGISEDDLELAFTQHATSKISKAEDLDKIFTLGFRGEALSSIGSVSQIEVETTAEEVTLRALFTKGELTVQSKAQGKQSGTTFVVKNLFGNVPARRKFLKTESTEFKKIQEIFTNIALANPGLHIELHKDGKLFKRLPSTKDLKSRIYELFGAEISENLYELAHDGRIKITGYIGTPVVARKDNKFQFLFLNGRAIIDKTVTAAVIQGYQGFIHKDQKPVYFLFIEINPAEVDVNVHPRKLEVKFVDTSEIFKAVYHSVNSTLGNASRAEIQQRIQNVSEPLVEPSTFDLRSAKVFSNKIAGKTSSFPTKSPQKPKVSQAMDFSKEIITTANLLRERPTDTEVSSNTNEGTLIDNLIQIFNTYIVYEMGNEVVFVDQHAAAEKIQYEKLMDQYKKQGVKSKPLLLPEIIEFNSQDKSEILELQDQYKTIGIDFSDLGGTSLQINEVPEIFPSKIDLKQLLLEIRNDLEEEKSTSDNEITKHVIATLACHGSIRAGQKLTVLEMRQLLNNLSKCQDPYNCPHGRPVSWTISRGNLEKNFSRIL